MKFTDATDMWSARLSEPLNRHDSASSAIQLMLVDEAPPLDSAFSVIFDANSNAKNKTIAEEDGISTGFKDLLRGEYVIHTENKFLKLFGSSYYF